MDEQDEQDETWTLTDWAPGCGFHCFLCGTDQGPWPWLESEQAEEAARSHVCEEN